MKLNMDDSNLEKAVFISKKFQKYLVEFIEKLVNAYPEEFEANIKDLTETLKPLRDEDLGQYTTFMRFKRSETFKYMVRYASNLKSVQKEIQEKNLTLFEPPTPEKPGGKITQEQKDLFRRTPDNALAGFDINFRKIWKAKKDKAENRKTVLIYLSLLYRCATETIDLFELSKSQVREIEKRKKLRSFGRAQIKEHVYKMLGAEGRNKSTEIVVDCILEEMERNKNLLMSRDLDPKKMQTLFKKVYDKLEKLYLTGELDKDELVNTTKLLVKNVMSSGDCEVQDKMKEMMEMMNTENMNEETINAMLEKSGAKPEEVEEIRELLGKLKNTIEINNE